MVRLADKINPRSVGNVTPLTATTCLGALVFKFLAILATMSNKIDVSGPLDDLTTA